MAPRTRPDDDRLLYKIARAYHDDGATQERLARRFGLSRPKVSRLLQQARESGVVHISIRQPESGCPDLERELEQRFGLDEAVLAERDRTPALERVGTAAASFFARTVQPGDVIGLSWGTSLRAFASQLPHLDLPRVTVVQLIGGLGSLDSGINGAELTRRVAERCGARPRILQAPGVVAAPAVRAALVSDREIAQSLDLGRKATMAFIGLGVPRAASALFGPEGLLSRKDLEAIVAKGAVADICLRYIDAAGQPVKTGLDDRVLGIALPAFLEIARRVAIAAGPEKVPAIRAALAGRLVNVLVSDEDTARALLEG